ncbi:glycoside hydrolase family 5 protein [Bradyrhizobium amphicarpaeae]|nr:cellulase family glycosylhydrolase [Bradyrhizobium amphicarpaeae]
MMTSSTPPRYVWPPFTAETHPLRPDDLARLKTTGFDTIRLTVGLGIFLSADAKQATELDEIVLDRLRRILDAGLNVILDFHPISQDPRFPPQSFTEAAEDPNAALLRQLESRMARLLSSLPKERVALEILNEPATKAWNKVSASQWQETQQSYFEAVRAAAPNLTVVLSGCCACCNLDLMMIAPKAYNDANTYYTFHVYAPHPFTHQLTKDPKQPISAANFIGAISFPISGEELAEVERRARKDFTNADISDMKLRAQIARDLDIAFKRLEAYGTAAGVEAIFDAQVEWAKKNSIAPQRLFLGEFGVQRPGVDPASRRRWLETVRSASEKRGIPWSYWSFEGPQFMGLALGKESQHFDQVIIEALGMKRTN